MEPNVNELFALTPTKQDAVRFIDKLSSIADSLYDVKRSLAQTIDATLTIPEKQLLVAFIQKTNLTFQNPTQFQKLVAQLKEAVYKIPVISVTIAVEPTPELLHHIRDWLQQNCKSKIFLEIHVDPAIMGGVIISCGGKIKEFSVRKIFRTRITHTAL